MACKDKVSGQSYLRKARLEAGYSTITSASLSLHFSPEAVGRHERGEVSITPDDALLYAQIYNNNSILHRYCAECPIGKTLGNTATDRPLALAVLRINHVLVEAQKVADDLEKIAYDGVIDDSEQYDFDQAIEFLKQLKDTISDLLLIQSEGKRNRAALAATKTAL